MTGPGTGAADLEKIEIAFGAVSHHRERLIAAIAVDEAGRKPGDAVGVAGRDAKLGIVVRVEA